MISPRHVTALRFSSEKDKSKMAEAISTAMETGYSCVDACLVGNNGKPIPYHWTGASLKDENRNVIGLTGVGIDFKESTNIIMF